MKHSLAELILMNSMIQPERPTQREHIQRQSLTSKQWTKRKSRSKITQASKKRNRK